MVGRDRAVLAERTAYWVGRRRFGCRDSAPAILRRTAGDNLPDRLHVAPDAGHGCGRATAALPGRPRWQVVGTLVQTVDNDRARGNQTKGVTLVSASRGASWRTDPMPALPPGRRGQPPLRGSPATDRLRPARGRRTRGRSRRARAKRQPQRGVRHLQAGRGTAVPVVEGLPDAGASRLRERDLVS